MLSDKLGHLRMNESLNSHGIITFYYQNINKTRDEYPLPQKLHKLNRFPRELPNRFFCLRFNRLNRETEFLFCFEF